MPLIEAVEPLSKFMKVEFRQSWGIDQMKVVQILRNLHALVTAVHQAGVIIGDFNDKNVLVNRRGEVFLIDTDSAQWGPWKTQVATAEFTDPTLLTKSHVLRDGASYSYASDWYSFTVIAYQLFTLTHPYRDGVHRPVRKPGTERTLRQNFPDRVTTRLSVFDPTVHLGKGVHRPASLPEELGRFMRDVFTKDGRATPFPLQLLTSFRWMTCRCGREHGRRVCPNRHCKAPGISSPTTSAIPAPVVTVPPPSAPTSSRIKGTAAPKQSTYLAVALQGNLPRYVYHTDGTYCRENGAQVLSGPLDPAVSALVAGNRTVLSKGTEFVILNGDRSKARKFQSQRVNGKLTVAANSRHVYWVSESSLLRDDNRRGVVTIGQVIPNMTSVWAGERFGVAMVRAGVLTRVLVFDAERVGLTQSHALPPEFGTIVDAHCAISDKYAWLTVTSRSSQGAVTNKCYLFNANAQLLATAEAPSGQNTWLGQITPAVLAVSDKLLVPLPGTGIVRIGAKGNALVQEGVFQGTAPYVTDTRATVGLSLTSKGLVHVGRNHIQQINP